MDLDFELSHPNRSEGLTTTAGPAARHGGIARTESRKPAIVHCQAPPESVSPTSTHARSPSSSWKEKNRILGQVRSLSWVSLSTELGVGPPEERPAWIPTWLRPLPLVGILALILALCCLFASLGVLVESNGQPVDSWPWAPSVFLAILAAMSNNSIHFALAQAVPVAWWYQASRGNTITQLQHHWEAGQGLFRAILRAPHARVLAIATIASALVIMDGPFMQKSSRVVFETQTTPVTLQISITPELPRGASGSYGANGFTSYEAAERASDDFVQQRPIVANVAGCEGSCAATIQAPGVTIMNCTTNTYPITRDMLYNASASWGIDPERPSPPMPLFRSSIFTPIFSDELNYVGPERMQIMVGSAEITDCEGQYVERRCDVQSMVMEYQVNLTNNRVELLQPASQGRNISTANNTDIDLTTLDDVEITFVSLGYLLQTQIVSNASLVPATGRAGSSDRQRGSLHMPDSSSFNTFAMKYRKEVLLTEDHCEVHFNDPMPEILSNMNNMMIRMGLWLASNDNTKSRSTFELDPGLQIDQTISANQTLTLNVFRTDLRWFAGAAVLEIVAILAIAPVFWGFWRLGLRMTMSPFEIANIFGAPLLKDVNSAAGSLGIVRAMGDVRVKFGVVQDKEEMIVQEERGEIMVQEDVASRLAVADAETVVTPRRRMRFRE